MPVLSRAQELLQYAQPFRIGSGRLPGASELKVIDSLIGNLEERNPTPVLKNAFERLTGMWECVFTSSRFVLDLDYIPFVSTSAVYQQVIVHRDAKTGHYFNIAELSHGDSVKCVCGECASIRPSESHAVRLNVQYEWFYFGWRLMSAYEGHQRVADELGADGLAKSFRLPFRGCGWQSTVYLDDHLRIVRGNKGGIFVLVKRC